MIKYQCKYKACARDNMNLYSEIIQEVKEWEYEHYIQNMNRMYKTQTVYKDPRKKAFQSYRHHRRTKWFYTHENKFVKYYTNRKLRRKLKQNLYNEAYYKVVPHDYKTYGWITW